MVCYHFSATGERKTSKSCTKGNFTAFGAHLIDKEEALCYTVRRSAQVGERRCCAVHKESIKTVCFTGHRSIPSEHMLQLPALLDGQLRALIARGATDFRAGGAMGFDMAAELKVLELKAHFPDIRLHLYLPCHDQARLWAPTWRHVYEFILNRADSVCYAADNYTRGCMLQRNRQMVRGSDVCVSYCTKSSGGSFYTCEYARQQGLELISLADVLGRLDQ